MLIINNKEVLNILIINFGAVSKIYLNVEVV